MKILLFILLFLPATSQASEIRALYSLELGILTAPNLSPEVDYDKAKVRFGVEFASCLYEIDNMKLLKFGLGFVDNSTILTLSPFSVRVQEKLYMAPTLGFGKHPYTAWSIAYEMW